MNTQNMSDILPGSMVLAFVVYGLASVLSGQVMSERMIDKSGWYQTCETMLVEEAKPRPRPKNVIPERRCSDTPIALFIREVGHLCHSFGDPDINGPARKAEEEARRRAEELNAWKNSKVASAAGSQCGCAAKQ